MAQKRMTSLKIVDSQAFLDMPLTAQLLYFHLNQRADDDGIIANAKRLAGYVGCSTIDVDILLENRFLLDLGDGILVIKHWKINNTINKDRYIPTTYTEKMAMLRVKKNKAYTIKEDAETEMVTNCNENVTIDKNSIDKNSIDNNTEIEVKDLPFNDMEDDEPYEKAKNIQSTEDFFEEIWKLYPLKKGKGQVSLTKKQLLQRIGYEEIKRCVERFIKEFDDSGKDRQFMMYGSTFFNSGYVDYLDKNYIEENAGFHPRTPLPQLPTEETEEETIDLWSD